MRPRTLLDKWREKYFKQCKPYKQITEAQAARMLGCTVDMLVEARRLRLAPTSYEKGEKVYYHRKSIFKWIHDLCARYPEDLEIFELYESSYPYNNDE